MNIIEIEKIINLLGTLGVGSLFGGIIIYLLIKSFLPSYLKEKAKNFASKEDIELITDKVESVKLGYLQLLEEIKSNNQLKFASIEREQNIKKEVYMDAVEAIVNSLNMIGSFSNLDIPEEKITIDIAKESGKIAKINVVGSMETVKAVTVFNGELGTAILDLLLKRGILINRRNLIKIEEKFRDKFQSEFDYYLSLMKSLNFEGNKDAGKWDYLDKCCEFERERMNQYNNKINDLNLIQAKEHLNFIRECMDKFFEINNLLPEAILSVRKELDLEISEEEFLDIYNDNTKKIKAVFVDFLDKIKTQLP